MIIHARLNRFLIIGSLLILCVFIGCENSNNNDQINYGNSTISGTLKSTRDYDLNGTLVTHVMAVNTSTKQRMVAAVESDGSFSLDLDKGYAWTLVFLNSNNSGINMLVGAFKSGTLDSLAITPSASNSVALGDVDITDADAQASAFSIVDLGLTTEGASFWGSIDDLCKRYFNPDLDNNGIIDTLQADGNIGLDFHIRFDTNIDGERATLSDLKNQFLSDTLTLENSGNGILLLLDSNYFSSRPTEMIMHFPGSVTTDFGTGTDITAGYYMSYSTTDMFGCQVTGTPPSGDYIFELGGTTISFYDVVIPDFAASAMALMPFIRINTDESDYITGIDWIWKKNTGSSWIPATQEEVDLIVGSSGGYVSLKFGWNSTDGGLGFSITTDVNGSTSFADAYKEAGTLYDGVSPVLFSDVLTNPGISYDDKLGMRYFY